MRQGRICAYGAAVGCAGAGFRVVVDFGFFVVFLVLVEDFFSLCRAVAAGVACAAVATCGGEVTGAIACMGGGVEFAPPAAPGAGTLTWLGGVVVVSVGGALAVGDASFAAATVAAAMAVAVAVAVSAPAVGTFEVGTLVVAGAAGVATTSRFVPKLAHALASHSRPVCW
jgi:hypothetical protein